MSDVIRYADHTEIYQSQNGRFVEYDDYQALAAQLAAVTAERDGYKAEADRRTREVELTFKVQSDLRTRAEQAEAALARVRACQRWEPRRTVTGISGIPMTEGRYMLATDVLAAAGIGDSGEGE